MGNVFDTAFGQSTLDPNEAARRSSRTIQRKRFYTSVSIAESSDGFGVLLDGKPTLTPARRRLAAPVRPIAEVMAAEWEAQSDLIDPMVMPLTRLANSVIDGVADRTHDVAEDVARYASSDLLLYRADHPDALVVRQGESWDPVLYWAADDLKARFILAQGVMHIQQPDRAIAAIRAALPADDPWRLGALHAVTTLTGSALLALALARGRLDEEAIWQAAHVDEHWNMEQWGSDDEVAARLATRRRDFDSAACVLAVLRA